MLRPRSILQLVLIGFGIVTIPLLAAFIVTAMLVSDLGRSGQQAILRAADVVQESRVLVEQAEAMERNGRQYLVLDDPDVLQVYRQRRTALGEAISALRRMGLTDTQRELLGHLATYDADLWQRLAQHPADPASGVTADDFTVLAALARGVLAESGQLITTNIDALSRNADRVNRLLLTETLVFVPAAILLAGIFVYLINRPLRVLGRAIKRLGAGGFEEPVVVHGPRDLRQLGEQLEAMRLRLLELENQKSLFLRNISHELKTPLTTLREGTQLLGEQVVGPLNPEQREVVDLLRHSSLRLQRMIEDLLQFSVAQSAPLPLVREPVALHQLIEQVLEEQRLPAQARGVRFEAELAPLTVNGDRLKLKAVAGNLVSNAIKFSPSRSVVHISLKKGGNWILFEVRDHGRGIPKEDRNDVFEAFFRHRGEPERQVGGTGLGLFIAREFVRLHDGSIDVIDCADGTCLQVCLPAATNTVGDSDAALGDAGKLPRPGGRLQHLEPGEPSIAPDITDSARGSR